MSRHQTSPPAQFGRNFWSVSTRDGRLGLDDLIGAGDPHLGDRGHCTNATTT